jgi:hypothetical protein
MDGDGASAMALDGGVPVRFLSFSDDEDEAQSSADGLLFISLS